MLLLPLVFTLTAAAADPPATTLPPVVAEESAADEDARRPERRKQVDLDELRQRRAATDIAEALSNGEMVCVFPEGRITDTGEMYPFKNGIQRIVERSPVPVYPVALQGMWGSFSSRKGGAAFTKMPRRFKSRVAVSVGHAVAPAQATPEYLEACVRELRGNEK